MGRVEKIMLLTGNVKFHLNLGSLRDEVKVGDSVSVNGVCLTVTSLEGDLHVFEAISETLTRTNMGRLKEGDSVNLEASLKLTDRLGGHIVMGHVDATGDVVGRDDDEGSTKFWIRPPKEILRFAAPKGSIAADGVSLTLVDAQADRFSVSVTPYTLQNTTLGLKRVGDKINIEVDILARYVESLMRGLD